MKSPTNDDETKVTVSEKEEQTQAFWEEKKIFERTLEQTKDGKPFVFYDGPPFATGLPHYGHLVPGTIKDIIPRYQTMRGRYVHRKWGWDCHGLPIENLIEDELGLKNKQDIEEYGVEKFNDAACNSVMRYDKEWKEIVPRMGRWIDMEDSYKTMDWQYSESIWWAFKELWKKKYIYEGYKSMHICPRCETTLSNNEVADGYKTIKDLSVTAKFELVNEPGTFVLAWTTTPWTLPGNVALAVGEAIEYTILTVEANNAEGLDLEEGQKIIIANTTETFIRVFGEPLHFHEDIKKANVNFHGKGAVLFKDIELLKSNDLVGKSYRPLFDYYSKDENFENRENGWKLYSADFVTTDDGTGVVHIAPAFGEDDMNMGKEHDLPFVQHVTMSGRFKEDVIDFTGKLVKPKDNHQEADIEIVKYLAQAGTLFSKLKYEHSYPHCWRCKTPLLNYAASSWFVKVTDFSDKLIAQNNEISWTPGNMKEGRFGNWLAGARDWAISRSRYWGAPFPVWRCDSCQMVDVIGSLDELKEKTRGTNTYTAMRHGEAESNVKKIVRSQEDPPNHITDKGVQQVIETAKTFKKGDIDIIIASPLLRTKETAQLVADAVGIDHDAIIFDERIREVDSGDLEGCPTEEYHACFATDEERFVKKCPGGEDLSEVKMRVGDFLYDIDSKYTDKNILIVAHDYPIWLIQSVAKGLDIVNSAKEKHGEMYLKNGATMKIDFAPLPHNRRFETDMHRPYIDAVPYRCGCGGEMSRVLDVFDCWFESGSMPYAQLHYPFENKETFDQHFPADFIAEGVDQTRGWFYNMLVLSTGVFDQAAFKNVVVNGVILAEDGQKMSKSLKNYPDPMLVVEKHGADALRYYLMSSPIVRGEALNFSETGVGEVYRKVVVRLENVLSFYAMYKDRQEGGANAESTHVLDVWILTRLEDVLGIVSGSLDTYEIDRATRPIGEFIDDLSTWYLRRSRTRIKEGDDDMQRALQTLQYVLQEFSKIAAPFMPFVSERVYTQVKDENAPESVHLAEWPEKNARKKEDMQTILEGMEAARDIVSQALEIRAREGIKVRQPLATLTLKKSKKDIVEYQDIIADEVNVKEVVLDDSIENLLELSLDLTPELIDEGRFRDLVRNIQSLRKKMNLTPEDYVTAKVMSDKAGQMFVKKFEDNLTKATLLKKIVFTEDKKGDEIHIDEHSFVVSLEK